MDRLWVPILTHYRNGQVDAPRISMHMRAIRQDIKSVLVAGSTGDGWDLDDRRFGSLLTALENRATFTSDVTVMVGVLRSSTDGVLARIEQLKSFLDGADLAPTFAGITVCPPVQPNADQTAILRHYEAVLEASPWPISVYQLPQVTGCVILPETLEELSGHSKVVMFKDSSGEDLVASSENDFGKVALVRGAEGRYLEHLAPASRYDGWLLSTGNVFAPILRDVLELQAAGDYEAAQKMSAHLTNGVETLFAKAAEVPFSNAFSNANRAADHVMAHGTGWRGLPAPETVSGDRLPSDMLETAEQVVTELLGLPQKGYLQAGRA